MSEPCYVVGVDFAGPQTAPAQRRKILAIAARPAAPKRYVVEAGGFNSRLTCQGAPGWTAAELAHELITRTDLALVAADFPFSIPASLLTSVEFAGLVGWPTAFTSWSGFAAFVSARVVLVPPLDLTPFRAWRASALRPRHWAKRATDVAAGAQPPLKDRYQSMFNMTLLGTALLRALQSAGYAIVPFDAPSGGRRTVVEVYPGATMRVLGRSDYKQDPARAIDAVLRHCRDLGVVIDVDPVVLRFCETYDSGHGNARDPDGSDALIALCVGILKKEGGARQLLPSTGCVLVGIEGVIWSG